MLKYLILMGVRIACFGLLFITPSPWRWFFAAGAIILPYIAVLFANAVSRRSGQGPQDIPDVPPPAIQAPFAADTIVITGEVLADTHPTHRSVPGTAAPDDALSQSPDHAPHRDNPHPAHPMPPATG